MTTSEFSYNLAGTVRHQGLPVAGVTVIAYELFKQQTNSGQVDRQGLVNWQKTSAKGDFSLAVKAGLYRLEVKSSGNRFLNQSITNVLVTANTVYNINLCTGYVLSGKVLSKSGIKIADGTVVAQETDSSLYFGVAPVKNGTFSVVLPRGQFYVAYRPLPPDNFTQAQTNEENDHEKAGFITPAYLASELTDVEIIQDKNIEIILPALVTFNGKIFDHSNATVSGVIVTARPSELLGSTLFSELGLAAKCQSDSRGNFQFFLQPGSYDFELVPEQSSSLFTCREEHLSIYENCDRSFHLKEGCYVEGDIEHRGEPIADCSITIFDSADRCRLSLKTDSKGHFKTTLPKGQYKMLVCVNEPLDQTIIERSSPILAPAIRELDVSGKTTITMELKEGKAIFGKVVDEARRPRTGVQVCAFLHKPNALIVKESAGKSGIVLNSSITDGDGYYYMHLAPGNYSMVVNNDFSNAKFAELSMDALELDFTLAGWRQLSLEIVGADGRRLSNCRLGYAPYSSSNSFPEMHKYENVFDSQWVRGCLFTGVDGIVKTVLPSGLYTLEIAPPKDSSYDGKLIRQLSLSNDIHRRIVLPLKDRSTRPSEELRLV